MVENKLENSKFRIEHTSDVLRILTLYKYGGLYMDLDVLSIFPIRVIDRKNFVCLEGNNHFSNAIIRLDLNEGKKFSSAYVEYEFWMINFVDLDKVSKLFLQENKDKL